MKTYETFLLNLNEINKQREKDEINLNDLIGKDCYFIDEEDEVGITNNIKCKVDKVRFVLSESLFWNNCKQLDIEVDLIPYEPYEYYNDLIGVDLYCVIFK